MVPGWKRFLPKELPLTTVRGEGGNTSFLLLSAALPYGGYGETSGYRTNHYSSSCETLSQASMLDPGDPISPDTSKCLQGGPESGLPLILIPILKMLTDCFGW